MPSHQGIYLVRFITVFAAAMLMAGCSSAYIQNPGPQTRNLVQDLRLEGFNCIAYYRDIICTERNPSIQKQPSKCSSRKGCVAQPDLVLVNQYEIREEGSGVPSVKHRMIRRTAP